MIAVVVSSQNRCYYCLTAHGAAVRVYSGDPALGEMMVMNYRAAKLTKKQRAMLDFAVKITNESWAIEEEDREGCAASALPIATSGTSRRSRALQHVEPRRIATDMRPNAVYHGQAR